MEENIIQITTRYNDLKEILNEMKPKGILLASSRIGTDQGSIVRTVEEKLKDNGIKYTQVKFCRLADMRGYITAQKIPLIAKRQEEYARMRDELTEKTDIGIMLMDDEKEFVLRSGTTASEVLRAAYRQLVDLFGKDRTCISIREGMLDDSEKSNREQYLNRIASEWGPTVNTESIDGYFFGLERIYNEIGSPLDNLTMLKVP